MHVTKIKIKQDRVFVEYDKSVIVNKVELINKYSIDSPEQPVEGFKKAFQAMDFFLIELCELADKPEDVAIMCEDVGITGLTLKYSDGNLNGAIITGTKALAYSNSPLVLNTPLKTIIVGDDGYDQMKHFTNTCVAALIKVVDHAERYVGGERLQIEMDLKDGAAKEANPEKYKSHQEEGPNAGKGDEVVSRETIERVESDNLDNLSEREDKAAEKLEPVDELPKAPKTSNIED